MRKFREKKNFPKKKEISRTIQNFKEMLNFGVKITKNHQKRLNFEITRLIFKEGFIRL